MTAITVTAGDIAEGRRESCTDCPVALAIEGALGAEVWVGESSVTLELDCETAEVGLPGEARKFIHSFDLGLPVEPFTFTLDYPAVTP